MAAKEHGAKLLKGFNNRKKLFLHCSIVVLSWCKLGGRKQNRFILLHDNGSKLIVTGISLDVKRKIMVRVGIACALYQECFHLVKCLLALKGPFELVLAAG